MYYTSNVSVSERCDASTTELAYTHNVGFIPHGSPADVREISGAILGPVSIRLGGWVG